MITKGYVLYRIRLAVFWLKAIQFYIKYVCTRLTMRYIHKLFLILK